MDKERDGAPLSTELARYFGTFFTMAILAISLVGLLLARYAPDVQDISTMFASGGFGLSYSVILQIAGFSFILAAFAVLVITERFITIMRFWLRILLLFLSTLITFSIFAVVFKWFPIEDPHAWLGFVLSTFICFAISLGLSMLKVKLEGKKYDRLLAKYKARRSANPPDNSV